MDITEDLVQRLVTGQFPQWSHLPIRPVAIQGNDNRTYRLGDHLALRLPSHESYVAGISKEDRFLPLLAERHRLRDVWDRGSACDLVIAWTFLRGDERQIFREAVGLPDDAWARARGRALWKALITMREAESPASLG